MNTLDFCKDYWKSPSYEIFGSGNVLTANGDEQDYEAFLQIIEQRGWKQYDGREELGNRFATYCNGGEALHISYFSYRKMIRMVVEAGDSDLPPRREDQTLPPVVNPLVTQVKLAYCKADCGMSYVIRLSDGRFVIIDGGYDEYEEAERLYDILCQQNVLEKITVAAWMITHPHGDHYLCFMKFMEEYGDCVCLEHLLYNWPLPECCKYPCNTEAYDQFVAKLSCKIIVPHTGQRFCYGDAIFDVLFATEDLYPNLIKNTNDTSLVFRMDLGGKRFLWLADAEVVSCEEICRSFSAEALKCDVLQVGHHGYDGGSPELYRRSDPEILLWPCPDFWYHVVRLWKSNDFLRNSGKIKRIFIEAHETTVLDMSLEDPFFASCVSVDDHHPLSYEDFGNVRRVIDLGWSCITGGDTGYLFPYLSLFDGVCQLDRTSERGVCQLQTPKQMEGMDSYMLTISGYAPSNEKGRMGILINDPNPTVRSDNAVLWLPIEHSEGTVEFECALNVDSKNGQGVLRYNGAEVLTFPYQQIANTGMYLVLENICVRLKKLLLQGK